MSTFATLITTSQMEHISFVCVLVLNLSQDIFSDEPSTRSKAYKLHEDILKAHSILFRDMFTIGEVGTGCSVEGRSDEHPIRGQVPLPCNTTLRHQAHLGSAIHLSSRRTCTTRQSVQHLRTI